MSSGLKPFIRHLKAHNCATRVVCSSSLYPCSFEDQLIPNFQRCNNCVIQLRHTLHNTFPNWWRGRGGLMHRTTHVQPVLLAFGWTALIHLNCVVCIQACTYQALLHFTCTKRRHYLTMYIWFPVTPCVYLLAR